MKIELISIGDELLIGATVNTNAAFIAAKLTQAGAEVRWISTIGDNKEDLLHALKQALSRADVVITTGGLGPTHDDITKKIIAEYFNTPLIFNQKIFNRLETFFRKRGRIMPESNRCQAEVPQSAEVLENPIGSAPGLLFRQGDAMLFILPGVPLEAERMTEKCVLPKLESSHLRSIYHEVYLHTIGIAESALADKLLQFESEFPDIKRASLPGAFGVTLRLSLYGEKIKLLRNRLDEASAWIYKRSGEWIYGTDNETIEMVVGDLLREKHQTLSIAESCTGGFIASRITDVPGSSAYFDSSAVTYSNTAKAQMLGVPESTLKRFGAVSEETVKAMAEGVRRIRGTDFGLAVTGIAGPGGGTREKPVGLVYMACADEKSVHTEKHLFFSDRVINKSRATGYALDLLRRKLLNKT